MYRIIYLSVVAFVLLLTQSARGDFPVHCLWSDSLQGEPWTFTSTQLNMGRDEGLGKCGVRQSMEFPVKSEMKFQLPNIVQDNQGNSGTFNIFYDQGFQVKIDGKIFLVSFNFTTEGKKTTSYCHETLTGIVRTEDNQRFGCFRAHRAGSRRSLNIVDLPEVSSEPFDNNQAFVDRLNKAQSSWQAANHEFLSDMSLKDVQSMAGQRTTPLMRSNKMQQLKRHAPADAVLSEDEYRKALKARGLPKIWDWRNINGKSYVSPMRNQASCGSCYSFATTALVESRWLQSGRSVQVFSPQDVVSCTSTNNPDGSYRTSYGFANGCQGGFAFQLLQYGETVGFNTEECYPYQGIDTLCSPKCQNRTKTQNHHYVGAGYMSGASELDIMQALHDEGPMSVNIQVYRDFLHYKQGVYHHVDNEMGANDSPQEWIEANHLVQLVGYTEVNGERAWILKNSWGEKWGMNGFGYIRRGNPMAGGEIAIRSAVVGTDLA